MADTQQAAHFQSAAEILPGWWETIVNGTPPSLYKIGDGELGRIEIGPGLVTLLGGAPGAGKTAFVMQSVLDALRLNTELRACVCNVEMSAPVLLDRQLARLSGIDLTTIRYRQFTEAHGERLAIAMETLEPLAKRLCFVNPPYSLDNIAAAADGFGADLIVLDYIQRITPPGSHSDKRLSVNATMDHIRRFADSGAAVIVLSAVGRTKDGSGRSSYHGAGLNLASFRESSEIEFGADDAFILVPDDELADMVTLKHLKARHSEAKDLQLRFDRTLQRFSPVGPETVNPFGGGTQAELQAAWNAAGVTVSEFEYTAEGDNR